MIKKYWHLASVIIALYCACLPATFASPATIEKNERNNIEKNITLINSYYRYKGETPAYDSIVSMATTVIKNSQNYQDTIRAKAYVLLADAAIYQGDTEKAVQFSQDGLTQGTIDTDVKLNLLMKVSAGFYIQSNYQAVLNTIEQVLKLTESEKYLKYRLSAFGYQATIYALKGDYEQAYERLKKIDDILAKNPRFTDQIELLQILALANHNLRDFNTSLALHLKLLQIQFNLNLKENIERTYYYLAQAYLKLERYDDAYNTFWQVKLLAEKKSAPILLAYAELGMGETLYEQGNYDLAYSSLIKAEKLFRGKNLTKLYLTNLIVLSKVAKETGRTIFASQLLKKAEELSLKVQLDPDQIILYQMLAHKYKYQGNYKKALALLNKYLHASDKLKGEELTKAKLPKNAKQTSQKSKELAIMLSEKGSLYADYNKNHQRLISYIWGLVIVVIILAITLLYLWVKYRNYRLQVEYSEVEQPKDYLLSPTKTKNIYQQHYKEARKFEYPLTVVYILVRNWHDLSHHFTKRVMKDVHKAIASLINENISEFEISGCLNQGEYIVLFPHRNKQELATELTQLSEAIKTRFFANLGEFSVIIEMSAQTPDIQDIDPFVFLAQLTEQLKSK